MKAALVSFLLAAMFPCKAESGVYKIDSFPGPVYYDSAKPMDAGDKGEIAVVMIHGWGGGLRYLPEQESLEKNLPGIYVVAPRFPRMAVFKKQGIEYDGRPRWNDGTSADLTKEGDASDDWRGGGDANGFTFSSFDVVDKIFSTLSDRNLYPNLRKIVLVGYSAGGQFVSRYVAVGKGEVREGVSLEYVSMAASTYLNLNDDVPWIYGLKDRPRYCAQLPFETIMKNLSSRRVFYACGENDHVNGSTDRRPAAMLQGPGRLERMQHLQEHAAAYPEWAKMISFHIIPEIAHNAVVAYSDPEFIKFVTALPSDRPDYSKFTEENHPRLFFTEQGFKDLDAQIRKGDNKALTQLHESMMDIAAKDGLSDAVITFDAEKQKATFNGTARKIANRIISASYAYRMTGEKAYLDHAISNIRLFMDRFEEWTTGYWLENSELCLSYALAYDWLYKDLPQALKDKMIESLRVSGYEAARDEKKAWFYRSWNNWNPVCNASLTCAAIATYERHPEESAAVIEKAIATVPISLKGIYEPDGASAEGPSYWDYASNYVAIFNMALDDAFGKDFGMSSFEGFRRGAQFRLFAVSNTGQWFNYADCNVGGGGTCLALWYYAWKYGRTDMLFRDIATLSKERISYSRALFMGIACAQRLGSFETKYPSELLYTSRGEASIVIARSGWKENDAYLGLKGGKCKVNHSHMDEGSFVYEADGVRWAGEFPHPSYEDYRRARKALSKEDKSFKWYDKFVYNNRRHSTLTVNDCDMNEDGFAPVIDSFNTPERRGGALDLSEMFKGQVAKATRTAALINGHDLEIEDEISALPDKPAHVRWTLVTDADIKLTKGGIILEKEGKKMLVKADRRVGYKTWSSDPKDYSDNPVRRFESKSSKYWSDLCGYEFDIPAGSTIRVKTHFSSAK